MYLHHNARLVKYCFNLFIKFARAASASVWLSVSQQLQFLSSLSLFSLFWPSQSTASVSSSFFFLSVLSGVHYSFRKIFPASLKGFSMFSLVVYRLYKACRHCPFIIWKIQRSFCSNLIFVQIQLLFIIPHLQRLNSWPTPLTRAIARWVLLTHRLCMYIYFYTRFQLPLLIKSSYKIRHFRNFLIFG